MNDFTRRDLTDLLQVTSRPCVSIYMPTHSTGLQGQQDPIRLKNLLGEAENQLKDQWLRPAEARAMLQPGRDVLDDSMFWSQGGSGLALFLAPDTHARFRVDQPFDALLTVGDHFHIRPMLAVMDRGTHFLLLALSQNRVTLFEGNARGLQARAIPGLPRDMKTALNHDEGYRGSQVHTAAVGVTGKQGGVFHGQGGLPDALKTDLRAYFRQIDRAMGDFLTGASSPLMLACVDYLAPIYREVNTYPRLLETFVEGNPDYDSPARLHERAWPLVHDFFEHQRRRTLEMLRERKAGKAISDVEQVVLAALQGRVEMLLANDKAHVWGVYHPDSATVSVHESAQPDDVDLVDVAVRETLRHRGSVHAAGPEELSDHAPLGALLRY